MTEGIEWIGKQYLIWAVKQFEFFHLNKIDIKCFIFFHDIYSYNN